MTHRRNLPKEIPDWFLEAVKVVQNAERGVRSIDAELRNAAGLDGIDPRLVGEMLSVREALGAVKVCLSVTEMIAEKVLGELTGDRSPDLYRTVSA